MVNLQKTMDKWRRQGYTQGLDKTVRQFNNGEIGFEDLKQDGIPDVHKKPVEMFLGQEGLKEYEKQYKPQPGEYWWDEDGYLNRITECRSIYDYSGYFYVPNVWRYGFNMGVSISLVKKATPSEIEQELKRIAERLGYIDGVKVKSMTSGKIRNIYPSESSRYSNGTDKLCCKMENGGYVDIYIKGQWAEIIKDEETEKIAVHAPEPWQKEKVAKVWGISLRNCLEDFPDDKYIFINPDNGNFGATNEKNYIDQYLNYLVISFQDFCRQHGIIDKPDYVKKDNNEIVEVVRWEGLCPIYQLTNKTQISLGVSWQPATEKEYLEQENQRGPLNEMINKSGLGITVNNDSEKEPELNLNEEWYEWKGIDYENSKPFVEGAKDMAKAIYHIIKTIENKYPATYNLSRIKYMIKNGQIKPLKQ